ncbi:hypothetical protein BC835DRAFT_228166 [Cytidiella melzeri]|nr:hypothetical protein BC835DRAFT_228166 [Cytidiella melzeri]
MPFKNQRSGRSTRGGDSERLTITIPRRLRASPSDASSTTKTSLARRSTRSSHHATSSTAATTPIPELVEHRDHSVPLKAEEEADLDALSLSIERYTPEGHCSHELCALVRPILVNLGDYHSSAYGRDHDNVRDVTAAKDEALVAQSPHTTALRCRFCEGSKPRVFMGKRVTAFDLGRHLRVHSCNEHKPY